MKVFTCTKVYVYKSRESPLLFFLFLCTTDLNTLSLKYMRQAGHEEHYSDENKSISSQVTTHELRKGREMSNYTS